MTVIFTRIAALIAMAWPLLQPARAEDTYPSRFVRVITTTGTGSGADILTRILAEHLSREWGQQIVVENVPTGGGLVAAQQVTSAAPDGYTLLSASASTFTVLPIRQERAPVTLGRDLRPISYYGDQPFIVGVHPNLGVATIKELVELAKRDPDKVLFAGGASGSLPHMTGELLKLRSGAPYRYIPYRSAAEGLKDLLAGQINMVVDGLAGLEGTIASGHIKALAVTSAKRIPTRPDLPTVAETLPGFLSVGWAAMIGPAAMPDAIADKIHRALSGTMARPDVRARLEELGVFPVAMTPGELATFIKAEQEQWWPLIRQIVAQPEPQRK